METRSKNILKRPEFSMNRAVYKSLGYSDDDLERPIIGIANSWNTLVPGHFNLNQITEYVKRGVYRGGGTVVEFGVIGACDGTAQGHKGMHYILPSRELIANDIEVMAEAHQLDAIVLLGSCDKIVPGMLMAAARLDIPAILLPGGPMLGGVEFAGRKSDLTSVSEGLGMLKKEMISEKEYMDLEENCCPSCGSCSFYGTANTMCALSEALGMTLPGGALIPVTHPDRIRIALDTGMAICKLVKKNINSRQIINEKSIENAIKVCMGTSGSTNAVMHLTAIAYEAEADIDVLKKFDSLSKEIPQVAKVNPASKWNMEDFWMAGGIPRVIEKMQSVLDTDVMTCSGEKMETNIENYVYKFPENPEIVRDMENPFGFTGGVAVLRGNLAPNTGISKPGAIDPSVQIFVGTAKVYDSEEEAEEAILNRDIKDGDVVVIRYEGPKGGPGMREMYKAMKYLYGLGLNKTTALITDGRFSGTNNGCFVGHISPEAAEGGPIAVVEDGDIILIDVINGIIKLDISEKELQQRLSHWEKPEAKYKRGYLSVYSKLVSSANEGAVIKY